MHFSIVFPEFTTPFGASRGSTVLLDQCLHRFSDPPRKFRFRFVSLGILQVFSRVNRLTDSAPTFRDSLKPLIPPVSLMSGFTLSVRCQTRRGRYVPPLFTLLRENAPVDHNNQLFPLSFCPLPRAVLHLHWLSCRSSQESWALSTQNL